MLVVPHSRKWLFFVGLFVIALSIVLDSTYATDGPVPVPEPNILALTGVGGVALVLVSLFRRPRK